MKQGKLSAIFIKHLMITYSDKLSLSKKELSKALSDLKRFGPYEVMQIRDADIPHLSFLAKHELKQRNFG